MFKKWGLGNVVSSTAWYPVETNAGRQPNWLKCFGLAALPIMFAANVHSETCGIAVIKLDGVTVSTEDYCYADGLPGAPPGGGPTDPGHGSGGGGGGAGIGGPAPSSAVLKHADACAVAYSPRHLTQTAPTHFLSYSWGWVIDSLGALATTNAKFAPPPYGGQNWKQVDAITFHPNTAAVYTDVYVHAYSTIPNLINTLAHEYVHQQGEEDEDVATQVGDDAENAYRADDGAKCAGG